MFLKLLDHTKLLRLTGEGLGKPLQSDCKVNRLSEFISKTGWLPFQWQIRLNKTSYINCSVTHFYQAPHFYYCICNILITPFIAYSLSEYIGKSEPGFKHSVLLHPFRLVSYYDRLIKPHDDTETLLRKGEISAEELKRILHRLSPATDSEKLIDLFKEMHIVIPNFFRKGWFIEYHQYSSFVSIAYASDLLD